MRPLTADDIFRIRVNPFYAITVAPELVVEHEPQIGTDAWIEENVLALQAGAKPWLESLLCSLQSSDGGGDAVNPYQAIEIDPMFAAEHIYAMTQEQWVQGNVASIEQHGPQDWLWMFLRVLQGDYV
jgi:hypothetical protein